MSDTTIDPDDRERYVEKIRKLLAKAERAGTEAEAESFFAKAAELMTKWEVEDAELRTHQSGPISWEILSRFYQVSSFSPKQDAAAMSRVAKAVGLKGYIVTYVAGRQKPGFMCYGPAEDLDRFEMLWTSIAAQMVLAMKREEAGLWMDRNEQRAFRMGFKLGFASRIAERLKGEREKAVGTSLVLVGKSEAIVRAMPATSSMKVSGGSAYGQDAGRRAANSADLNHRSRVGGTTRKALS